MPAPLIHIETTPDLPQEADVVVIGGGVVGVFTAYYLARRGVKVALVEKGLVGAEQSSRNWGWCRQQNRDARELPLATKSLELWEKLAEETGEDTGFRRCGLLYLSQNENELAGWEKWRDFARTVGVTTHMLSQQEATEHGGRPVASGRGASSHQAMGRPTHPSRSRYSPGHYGGWRDRTSELRRTRHRSERRPRQRGGHGEGHHTHTDRCHGRRCLGVVLLSPTRRSFPASVDTSLDHGRRTRCERSARRVAYRRNLHDPALQWRVYPRYQRSGARRPTPQQLRFSREFIPMFARRWRSLAPGGLEGWRQGHESLRKWRLDAVTPMEKVRILDPKPDMKQIRLTHSRACDLMPSMRQMPISDVWAGYIDSTPDGVPAIGEIESIPGFVLAAGFSGHGFGIGPGAGHLIADLITGKPPIVDPRPYRPERLSASAWGRVADF